jgi:hypothetical protein
MHVRPCILTLVHGTFAKDAEFTHYGSALITTLKKCLGETTQFHPFTWTGHNTQKDRLAAGEGLRAFLAQKITEFPDADHFVVGHSHGGNIISYALDASIETKIRGVVTLGAPFLRCRERQNEHFSWSFGIVSGILISIFVYMVQVLLILLLQNPLTKLFRAVVAGVISSALMNILPGWLWLPAHILNAAAALLFMGVFLFYAWIPIRIGCWVAKRCAEAMGAFLSNVHRKVLLKTHSECFWRTYQVPFCVVTCQMDEASALLRLASCVCDLPFHTSRFINWLPRRLKWIFAALWLLYTLCYLFSTGSWDGGVYMGVTAIFLWSLLQITFMVGIPVLSQIVRSRVWAFGSEGIWDNIASCVTIDEQPEKETVAAIIVISINELLKKHGWKGLWNQRNSWDPFVRYSFFHGIMCNDIPTITSFGNWMTARRSPNSEVNSR